jgi:hypothetical protein
MKPKIAGLTFAFALASPAFSAQVEADFNDLYLGDTRTKTSPTSKNDGNINTGKGFTQATNSASGGSGEYNNNTGVVQFEKGDLQPPPSVSGFISAQSTPIDPDALGHGVVFGSHVEPLNPNNKYRRFQERTLDPSLTGSEIWFSFLFRLDGPLADGRILFNKSSTEDSSDSSPSAFAIALGHASQPGRIAIDVTGNAVQAPPVVDTAGAYFQGVEVLNPSQITSHVAIGRIINNPDGADTIEVWIDPPTTENLDSTIPTISSTDEIGAGITSIGFEGTRHGAPSPTGGPYVSGGHASIDHFRMSDDPGTALDFVTGNFVVDPKLIISSPTTNFNFRGVYGAGSPIVSAPLTVTLKNDGQNNPITIESVGLQTATSVFSVVTDPPIDAGLVLEPGQEIDITVQATGTSFETAFANSIAINTDVDDQDMAIGVGATFYTTGSRMHSNPGFESNLDGWINDAFGLDNTPPVRVAPGFLGSGNMVRLRGIGDPEQGFPDNFSQTVLNGASDWEFTFTFSPVDAANFANYAGTDVESFDRTFQVVIQSDGDVPTPAAATGGRFTNIKNADAAMINLAYLPAEGQGWSVFNGNNWESLGLPLLTGSTDTNNNGSLTPGTDTINYYSVRIRGTGFGTSQAKYSVSVTQPNSPVTAKIIENLTTWSSSSGESNTPGAFTFTTGDVSNSGIIGAQESRATSFWIDEVSFYAGAVRDPAVTFGSNNIVLSHNGVTSINSMPVTNTGFTESLDLSSLVFQSSGIFSTPENLISIPPGTTAQIPVIVNPAGFTGSDNAVISNLTMTTNIARQPSASISFRGSGTTDANLLPNWNFELPGIDSFTDWDTFAFWDEFTGTNLSKDMAGLVEGSPKGVHIAPGAAIRNTFGAPAGNFIVDTWLAVRDTTVRAFNLNLHSQAGTGGPVLNLRYEGLVWSAYNGSAWIPVIDMSEIPLATSEDSNADLDINDAGDTKNVYKLRLVGNGWDTSNPVYQVQILDGSGNEIASSAAALSHFQGGKPSGGARYYTLTAAAAGSAANAGFWADDVVASTVTADLGIVITSFTGGAGNFTIQWNSGGSPVIIERSYTLEDGSWETISEVGGDNDGTHIDNIQPPAGKAFYRLRKL